MKVGLSFTLFPSAGATMLTFLWCFPASSRIGSGRGRGGGGGGNVSFIANLGFVRPRARTWSTPLFEIYFYMHILSLRFSGCFLA